MKFTVNSENGIAQVEQFRLLPQEEADLETAIENMTKAVVASIAHFSSLYGGEKEGEMFVSLMEYLQITAGEFSISQQESSPEFPYEDMEAEFITWIYGQGYDDPYAFADRYEGVNLNLDFAVEDEDVSVYFADENGVKQEEIGSIPVYLFEDEPETAAAMCIEYTSIAVLCLDKLYSGINNPLRNRTATELEKRIKEQLE